MSNFKRDLAITVAAAAAGGLLIFVLLKYGPKTPESPILVRDGSMILESEGPDTLASRFEVEDDLLIHTTCGELFRFEGIPATGAPEIADCSNNGICRLVVTYTDGSTITVSAGKNGAGLTIKSKEKPFKGWNTHASDSRWVKDGTNSIDNARTLGTNNNKIICTGKGCKVRVTFKP